MTALIVRCRAIAGPVGIVPTQGAPRVLSGMQDAICRLEPESIAIWTNEAKL